MENGFYTTFPVLNRFYWVCLWESKMIIQGIRDLKKLGITALLHLLPHPAAMWQYADRPWCTLPHHCREVGWFNQWRSAKTRFSAPVKLPFHLSRSLWKVFFFTLQQSRLQRQQWKWKQGKKNPYVWFIQRLMLKNCAPSGPCGCGLSLV